MEKGKAGKRRKHRERAKLAVMQFIVERVVISAWRAKRVRRTLWMIGGPAEDYFWCGRRKYEE